MRFSVWLEESGWDMGNGDEEYSHEDLISHIMSSKEDVDTSSPIKIDYIDPDTFYNRGGVFSFTYSNRIMKHTGKPEGLKIAPSGLAHRYMVTKHYSSDHSPIVTGRYGIMSGHPILAIWSGSPRPLMMTAVREIFRQNLVHPETQVVIDGELLGPIVKFGKLAIPKTKDMNVMIGNRQYNIYELPGLLHTLPGASSEKKAIEDFILNNHDKYPLLKKILYRVQKTPAPVRMPDSLKRRDYWSTSESRSV